MSGTSSRRRVEAAARRGEFQTIAEVFAPLAKDRAALGLADDAALLKPDPGHDLVATSDMLVAGVHFFASDPPAQIARKALRVNLSDIAAMGAVPRFYLLTIAKTDDCGDEWMNEFAAGLAADQAEFSVSLVGGDTVSTPGPLSLTVTALGQVRTGSALRRDGACAGDLIFVSGTLGDAALGLATLRGDHGLPASAPQLTKTHTAALRERYYLPNPRTGLGPRLLGLASAAIDVSYGLIADLEHICAASGLGAEIDAAQVPLSVSARTLLEDQAELLRLVLTGGDDYELLFTVASENAAAMERAAAEAGVEVTRIGTMAPGSGVSVRGPDGRPLSLPSPGYEHF